MVSDTGTISGRHAKRTGVTGKHWPSSLHNWYDLKQRPLVASATRGRTLMQGRYSTQPEARHSMPPACLMLLACLLHSAQANTASSAGHIAGHSSSEEGIPAGIQPAVAIIGAGIAGATTAYHLQDLQHVAVDVFEGSEIGGRARGVAYKGKVLELGASIIWENNILLAGIAKELGLTARWLTPAADKQNATSSKAATAVGKDSSSSSSSGVGTAAEAVDSDSGSGDDDGEGTGAFAVWDGSRFVSNQTGGWLDLARSVVRYGPSPVLYGRHATQVWRDHFKTIYDLQAKGQAFTSVEDLLQETGLWNYTQQQCRQYMQDFLDKWWLWGADNFMEELAGAVNRCNYNQRSSTMNALAGLVSWLPAAGGGVWAVDGGNDQLATGMLNSSHPRRVYRTRISSVTRHKNGSFTLQALSSVPDQPGPSYGPYAAVVLAAPLELSGIKLLGVDTASQYPHIWASHSEDDNDERDQAKGAASAHVCLRQPEELAAHGSCSTGRAYQMTVTTYVTGGELQPAAFNVKSLPAQTVFVTESAATDFSSISGQLLAGERVYKVFSEKPLPDKRIMQLFGPKSQRLTTKAWWAYPRFNPPETYAPFQLAPGLCYTAALENAASAMEVAALAGRNCALLTRQGLHSAHTTAEVKEDKQQHLIADVGSVSQSTTAAAAA